MNTALTVIARLVRRVLTLAWVVAVVTLIGLAAWSRATDLVVVAGSSMEPAMPVGSLVHPDSVAGTAVRVSDVVTVRADNGVLITHRVVRIADLPTGLHFELQGDRNSSPDPLLVPADALVGRVDWVVPVAGFVVATLATPTGLISVLALLGAALVGIWLLEDVEGGQPARHAARVDPRVVGEAGRAAR